jgi:hypothetical protein
VCIIRGKFKGEDVARTLVTQDREDYWPKKNPLFDDVPHHWMMTDIDKWVSPTGIDPILNPVDAIQEWISICLPEEFHDKSFIWHLSSSAGHESNKGVLKAHIFHWLATPYTGSQLTAWARGLGIPLDVSVLRRVQAQLRSSTLVSLTLSRHGLVSTLTSRATRSTSPSTTSCSHVHTWSRMSKVNLTPDSSLV